MDTGKTLELVRRLYPRAYFATVYAKPQGWAPVDTLITEVSQVTWIFFPWDMACNSFALPQRTTPNALLDGVVVRTRLRLSPVRA